MKESARWCIWWCIWWWTAGAVVIATAGAYWLALAIAVPVVHSLIGVAS